MGYTVCHQLPTHSFFANGEQFPLCARCTGLYLGFLVGIAGMALLGKLNAALWPPRAVVAVLVMTMLLMVGDGFNSLTSSLPEAVQAYQPTNLLRLVTGILAGTALALLMVPSLNDALWAKRNSIESVSDLGELAGFVIIAALVAAVVLTEHPLVLLPITVLGSLGVLRHPRQRGNRPRCRAPPARTKSQLLRGGRPPLPGRSRHVHPLHGRSRRPQVLLLLHLWHLGACDAPAAPTHVNDGADGAPCPAARRNGQPPDR